MRRDCVPHLHVVFVNQPPFCTIVSLITRYIHAKLRCAYINQNSSCSCLAEGQAKQRDMRNNKQRIISNDVSFLFGLTQCVGPRSPAWQVCATKVTYCKGPIKHEQCME